MRAVDGRVEDPESPRAAGEDRLEADGTVRVAKLACGFLDRRGAPHAPECGRRNTEPVEELVRLGLVVRAPDRLRSRNEHGHGEALAVFRQPLQVE